MMVGTYEWWFYSKMQAASMVVIIIGAENTQILLPVLKKFELYGLSASGDAKTSGTIPCAHR